MGGVQSETEVDIGVVSTGEGDGGIAHGDAMLAFVDATMTGDPGQTAEAGERLAKALGDRGVVYVAAVAAMFQLNTRSAFRSRSRPSTKEATSASTLASFHGGTVARPRAPGSPVGGCGAARV